MNESHEKDTGGFAVHDHRRFDADGRSRDAEAASETAEARSEPTPHPEAPREGGAADRMQEPPPLNVTTFLLSLATSVQMYLGLIANPQTKLVETNLAAARETIDLLGILEEKTRGNLTPEEQRLLEHVLYDLRMQYLEQTQPKTHR